MAKKFKLDLTKPEDVNILKEILIHEIRVHLNKCDKRLLKSHEANLYDLTPHALSKVRDNVLATDELNFDAL